MAGTPSNSLNISGNAGLVGFDGSATFNTTPLTEYWILSGGATAESVNNITPTSNTGWVLTSNGLSAQPTFQAPSVSSFPWTDEAISFAAASKNGYFITANATATLPASPAQGDTIAFAVDSASGILTIQANTGQTISVGENQSAAAGTCVSNFDGDSITLVYRLSDTNWIATQSIGTFTVT